MALSLLDLGMRLRDDMLFFCHKSFAYRCVRFRTSLYAGEIMIQLSLDIFAPGFLDPEDAHKKNAESLLDTVRDVCDLHGHDTVAKAIDRPRASLSAAIHEREDMRNRKRIYLSDLPALLALDTENKLINQLVAMTVGRHDAVDLVSAALETIADPDIMTGQQRKSFLRSMKQRADHKVALKRVFGGE